MSKLIPLGILFCLLTCLPGSSLLAAPQTATPPETAGPPVPTAAPPDIHVRYQSSQGSGCREATPGEAQLFRQERREGLHVLNRINPNQSAGLKIILRGTAQLDQFPAARAAFLKAAATWEALIATPMTIIIDVDYGPTRFGTAYPAGVIGSTLSQTIVFTNAYGTVRENLIKSAANPTEAALYAALPTGNPPYDTGMDTGTLLAPAPVYRALGMLKAVADPATETNLGAVPSIGFNSRFTFDFDPANGIDPDKTDFDATAVHEIGHVLGFASLVGNREAGANFFGGGTVMDLFRFRPGITSAGFQTTKRILFSGGDQVLFTGTTQLPLSTGRANGLGGDGQQPSHWKDDAMLNQFVGIMDPTLADGVRETITQNDLVALDLFGYTVTYPVEPDRVPPRLSPVTVAATSATVGETVTVTWQSSDNAKVQAQNLALSLDGGQTFPLPVAIGLAGTAQSFTWTVPPGTETTDARVRVTVNDAAFNEASTASSTPLVILARKAGASAVAPTGLQGEAAATGVALTWKNGAGTTPPRDFSVTPAQAGTTLVQPDGISGPVAAFLNSGADGAFVAADPVLFGEQLTPASYPATLKSVLYLSMNSFFTDGTRNFPSTAGAKMKLTVATISSNRKIGGLTNPKTYEVTLQREPGDFSKIQAPTDSESGDFNEFVLPEAYTIESGSFAVMLQFQEKGTSGLAATGRDLLYVYDGDTRSTGVVSFDNGSTTLGVGSDVTLPTGAVIRPDFPFLGRVASGGGGGKLAGYNIYRSATTPVATTPANLIGTSQVPTFTDRTAAPGTRLFYVVTGLYEGLGESGPSNEVMVTTGNAADTTPPTVTVLKPNGGETVATGSTLTITWQSSDNVGVTSQAVELSLDGGLGFAIPVATGLPGTTQSFAFAVPATAVARQARVRVSASDAAGNKGSDVSDADFQITQPDSVAPTVKVLTPNGGETLKAGSTVKITWQATDNLAVTSQAVLLSTDGGATYSVTVAAGLAGTVTSLDFVVPSVKTRAARIRVVARDAAGNEGRDDSDGTFSIKVKKN